MSVLVVSPPEVRLVARVIAIVLNGVIQRFCLGLIFFFLLSVAERTFKQVRVWVVRARVYVRALRVCSWCACVLSVNRLVIVCVCVCVCKCVCVCSAAMYLLHICGQMFQ